MSTITGSLASLYSSFQLKRSYIFNQINQRINYQRDFYISSPILLIKSFKQEKKVFEHITGNFRNLEEKIWLIIFDLALQIQRLIIYYYSSVIIIRKMNQVSQQQINCIFQSEAEVKIFDRDNWVTQQETRQSYPSQKYVPTKISTQKAIPFKQRKTHQKQYDNHLAKKIQVELQNSKNNFFKVNITKNTRPTKQSVHTQNHCQVQGQKLSINTKSFKRIQSISQKNPNSILKEGFLEKKTDNFFSIFCWRTRFFALTSEKLYFFQDKTKQKVIGCINFKLMQTEIKKNEKDLQITLDFRGQTENLNLRCSTKNKLEQWCQILEKVLKYNQKQQKLCLMTMIKPLYDCQDSLTQKQFLKIAETGDLLLFYTRNTGAKIQRILTNSDFDHVAMIIKLGKNQVMVFQSNQMHGVSIYQWSQYIRFFDLYDKVTLRKLRSVRKQQMHHTFLSFAKKNLGKKYDLNAYKLFKLESNFNWEQTKQAESQNESRGFFCSELVAKAYKQLGLVDQKKFSGRYWPVDFSQKNGLKLKNGASLGSEQSIILNRHIKRKKI